MTTMSDNEQIANAGEAAAADPKRNGGSDVLVCVSDPHASVQAIPHAQAVAHAFQGRVVLLHVIEPPADHAAPVDPVEWDIKRREMTKRLKRLAQKFETPSRAIDVEVLEGRCAEQTVAYVARRPHDIVASMRKSTPSRWHQRALDHGVMASDSTSVLMIPHDTPRTKDPHYSRVFVPLDGSARAESALPKAARLAQAENADLVLCYVTPPPGLTQTAIMEPEAMALMDQVTMQNKQTGQSYLKRVKDSLADCGVTVSTKVVVGDDVRRSLIGAIAEEAADFLVMASHGQSGHMDVPAGDVASFILDRCDIPVLMVRQSGKHRDAHVFGDVAAEGTRQPAQARQ